MADIPRELQQPERGFRRLAVDLAGPYLIKEHRDRQVLDPFGS